jgi:diazepam-binding inhibitor (GABA receptor modulating acyl-CoA-binding protein)
MSDLSQLFQTAVTDSKALDSRPDNATMLKLYGLFKQSTDGDAPEEGPDDMIGKFKHKSWAQTRGMTKDAAMQSYIDLVESLK